MKGVEAVTQRPYPTDERGFAVSIYDIEEIFVPVDEENTPQNNHHYNFYKRMFGATAISQSFRDLEGEQVPMFVPQHQRLHLLFGGIALPLTFDMLERIEEGKANGERLKIYDQNQKKYVHNPITDIHIKTLKAEYNNIRDKGVAILV